jgi:hypothetical protein
MAIVFPLRDQLARSELRWLQRQWAESLADDSERVTAEEQLNAYLLVTDAAPLNAALASLYRDEQHRFGARGDRLSRALLVDHRLVVFRSDVVAALSHRAALLARVAAWYEHPMASSPPVNADNQSAGDAVKVDHDLSAARTHWGERQPAPASTTAPYSAAAAALARLSHWFDQPTGAVLLGRSERRLVRLDVDASRVVPTGVPALAGSLTPRMGYLAYSSGGKVWALAPDGSGSPRLLATGDRLFAADEPSAIWVGDSRSPKMTEVDGGGRVLRGPVLPPGSATAATSAGLVVYLPDQPRIEVWDPAGGRVACREVGTGREVLVLATRANLMAWASGDGQLRVTDVTTCTDRFRAAIDVTQALLQDAVAFSPDGRTLALASYKTHHDGNDAYPLELLEISSGRVTDVPLPEVLEGPIGAVAWTPDGTRLFWLFSRFGGSALLRTWRLGDSDSRPLRALGLALTPPLYAVGYSSPR